MTKLPHDEAETIFATWAGQAEAGQARDFSEVISEHPLHAEALQLMHADWLLFAPILQRVVPGLMASQTALPEEMHAASIDDSIQPVSSELIERLGIQLPDAGRYRFRGVLGRGGGGVVLRVWDQKLHRALAMKVVLGRGEAEPTGDTPQVDAAMMTRFVDEARISSQLDHPGIVPVHELGTDATGRAFFTMRLVKGEDLSKIFARLRAGSDEWTQVRALGVMAKVCEAVAFAHEKGVVHRDLKPANVMVGRHGEVHVMDWGLARVLGSAIPRTNTHTQGMASQVDTLRRRERSDTPNSPLLTRQGSILGTPAYMSPEQARADLECVDARSDVYAIGAMLYELIAGVVPFVPAGAQIGPEIILMRVLEGPPRALAKLAPKEPPELVAICEKAMERKPEQRYADVRALERDLRAYLERKVVKAYETGTWAETRKWVKRNRALAAAAATAVLAIAAGAVGFAIKASEARKQARIAESQERAAKDANAESKRLLATASIDAMHHGDQLLVSALTSEPVTWQRNIVEGMFQLIRAIETNPSNGPAWERLGNELAAIWQPLGPRVRAEVGAGIAEVEWSPDGTRLLTRNEAIDPSVWDADRGARLFVLPTGSATLATYSSDGVRILTIANKIAQVWDARDGSPIATLLHPGEVNDARFCSSGDRVVTGGADKTVRIWDASSGAQLHVLLEENVVEELLCNEEGSAIAVKRKDLDDRVWVDSGIGYTPHGPFPYQHHPQRVLAVHGSHLFLSEDSGYGPGAATRTELNGSRPVVVGNDYVFFTQTGLPIRYDLDDVLTVCDIEEDSVRGLWSLPIADFDSSAYYSSDGLQVAHVGMDGVVSIFQAFPKKPAICFVQEGALGAVFSPDGGSLLIFDSAGSVAIWTIRDRRFQVAERLREAETAYSTADNDKLVLVSSWNGAIEVYDWHTLGNTTLGYRNLGYADPLPEGTIRFADDVFVVKDERMRITPEGRVEVLLRLPPSETPRAQSSFSAAGDMLVTTQGKSATVWIDYGQRHAAKLEHDDAVRHALLTPDGARVVTSTASNEGIVWNSHTRQIHCRLEGAYHPSVARANVLSNRLAALQEGRVTIWDLSDGKRLGSVDLEGNPAFFVWFPNGMKILIQDTLQISVWNDSLSQRTWELFYPSTFLGTFDAQDAFGRQDRLAISGLDGVSIWDISNGTRLAHMRHEERMGSRATFSPDGRHLVCFHDARGGYGYRYAVRTGLGIGMDLRAAATPELVAQMHALVCYVTGFDWDSHGRLRHLRPAELSKAKSMVQDLAEQGGIAATLSAYFLDDTPTGAIEPGAKRTRRERADELLELGESELVLGFDPANPLVRTALTRDRQELSKLRDVDLARLPADGRLWAKAAKMLIDMNDRERARTAAKRALQLAPGDPDALRVAAVDAAELAIDRVLAAGPSFSDAQAQLRAYPGLDPIAREVAVERLNLRLPQIDAWLDELREACPLATEVRVAIAADVQRPEYQRAFALELLGMQAESAQALNKFSWELVWETMNPTSEQLDLGLRCARRAAELAPESSMIANTLGVAEYRSQRWDAALVALRHSDSLRIKAGEKRMDLDVGFLAMTLARLGKNEDALAELSVLEELVGPAPSGDEARILEEVRATVDR